LKDNYNFNQTLNDPPASNLVNPNVGGSGWDPVQGPAYHFNGTPVVNPWGFGGNGFGGSVWAGPNWDQGWGFWFLGQSEHYQDLSADFDNRFTIDNDPLRHPTFDYTLGNWDVLIDDYGRLDFTGAAGPTRRLLTDNLGGTAGGGAPTASAIESMDLRQGLTNTFSVHGYNRRQRSIYEFPFGGRTAYETANGNGDGSGGWNTTPSGLETWVPSSQGRDGAAGIRIDSGLWTIQTIEPESAPGANDGDLNLDGTDRYVIDRYGNIFDKFGTGNAQADYYNYTLTNADLLDNGKVNYVGNIFGSQQRVAQRTKVDTNTNNSLTGAELGPTLEFSERDYNKRDETIVLPAVGAMTAPHNAQAADPAINGSFGTTAVNTFNPSFAGKYIGFTEAASVTIGTAGVDENKFGESLNRLTVRPNRTGGSLTASHWTTTGDDQLDRDYNAIAAGATVYITDRNGTVIDTGATISARDANGHYTVTPSAGFRLEKGKTYKVITPPAPDARTGGTLENGMANILKGVLSGNEYREALRAGLLDDLMLSASTTDMFGGMISAKLTVSYNKRQERLELFQNSFATVFKSEKPRFPL
jgi:hypothetical protein